MNLLLVTLPGCTPCIRLKQNLDILQYSTIETPFTYEVISAHDRPDLVEKYNIQSAPCLVFPSGYVLRYSLGISPLEDLIKKEYEKSE